MSVLSICFGSSEACLAEKETEEHERVSKSSHEADLRFSCKFYESSSRDIRSMMVVISRLRARVIAKQSNGENVANNEGRFARVELGSQNE